MLMRTLLAAAAVGALILPATALAQSDPSLGGDVGGVIIQGQPRDAYVIRIDTLGKDAPQIRREIWQAAWTACERAPRTGNVLETRPSQMQWCASEASRGAFMQLEAILDKRARDSYVAVYGYDAYTGG